MRVLVIADKPLLEELTSGGNNDSIQVEWISDINDLSSGASFDACIDLLFQNTRTRIEWLNNLQAPMIIINSVIDTLVEIGQDYVRINGWPTFLQRNKVEATTLHEELKSKAEQLFESFGKKITWTPDIAGFLTARVIATIINEAYIALEEGVSTTDEIDIAMKLGTNYPYGPFEWSKKIGLELIFLLLTKLAKDQERYRPSALLEKNLK